MNVLDLFSGIGGFSLGFERAGMRTVAFCEIDSYCRRVLAKHWPAVRCYEDVRELTASRLRADGIAVDIICGGFPCQGISDAGKRTGLKDERSGLWREFARLICEIRPHYVVVENVAALRGRGLGEVLGDLAALGYNTEWHCIPAAAIGAPHRRDRIWILGYPDSAGRQRESPTQPEGRQHNPLSARPSPDVADSTCQLSHGGGNAREARRAESPDSREALANANSAGPQDRRQAGQQARHPEADWEMELHESQRRGRAWWESEPNVGRVAARVPRRVDRLRALGNAVVPQIAEMIGRIIMAREATLRGTA